MQQAYICDGVRSPIGRYAGSLSSVRPDNLLAHIFAALLERNPGLDPEAIDDVIVGCANQAGEDNRNVGRMSALLSGMPVSVPATTVNRLCGSGLDAISIAARAIQSGQMDLSIVGGVESMSRAPFVLPKAQSSFARTAEIHDTTMGWRFINRNLQAMHGVDTMPETAENVAERFHIAREDQDRFALSSQIKARKAADSGRFREEIVPVSIPSARGPATVFEQDEHLRSTSLEALASLPAPFRKGGTVTAGNSSGINDGAAAMIIASDVAVKRFGLKPRARIIGAAVAGVEPAIMGYGPAPATEKLLQRHGLGIRDIGIIELNEAFASQALAVTRKLGLPDDEEHVNPNGGAIALGHPLGMSGVRLALTASIELARRREARALCTMCIGVGQGIALIMERV